MENKQPKILQANATRFVRTVDTQERCQYSERPMTLTAWTQTTGEDFGELGKIDYNLPDPAIHGQNINKVLLDKIRVLQESLREHTEMLTQIHSTPTINNDLIQRYYTTPTTSQKILYISEAQNTVDGQLLPPQILTPPNSIININTVQQIPTCTVDSINYKIITDNTNDKNGEPLEIKLANESALNMSADSDRLEICMDNESDVSPSSQFIKRRKLERLETVVSKQATATPKVLTVAASKNNVQQDEKPSGSKPTPKPRKPRAKKENVLTPANENVVIDEAYLQRFNLPPSKRGSDTIMVSIGPNNTMVPADIFETINWRSVSIATRKLMMAVFDRLTMSSHSMTGKASPAFKETNRPLKDPLDPLKVQDIVFAITHKCLSTTEKEVRSAITTKCADENKMMRQKMRRAGLDFDTVMFPAVNVGGKQVVEENDENKENAAPK